VADIVLDKVTKAFPDGTLAVQEFNLEIADGEFVILKIVSKKDTK